jgi:hypothetical protein
LATLIDNHQCTRHTGLSLPPLQGSQGITEILIDPNT